MKRLLLSILLLAALLMPMLTFADSSDRDSWSVDRRYLWNVEGAAKMLAAKLGKPESFDTINWEVCLIQCLSIMPDLMKCVATLDDQYKRGNIADLCSYTEADKKGLLDMKKQACGSTHCFGK